MPRQPTITLIEAVVGLRRYGYLPWNVIASDMIARSLFWPSRSVRPVGSVINLMPLLLSFRSAASTCCSSMVSPQLPVRPVIWRSPGPNVSKALASSLSISARISPRMGLMLSLVIGQQRQRTAMVPRPRRCVFIRTERRCALRYKNSSQTHTRLMAEKGGAPGPEPIATGFVCSGGGKALERSPLCLSECLPQQQFLDF